jgi:hypothetical protein
MAVAAVVAVAAIDAFRGGSAAPEGAGTVPPPRATGVESSQAIANRLRHEGISGLLLYTNELCTLRAVSLPGLEPAATPGNRGLNCAFSASPDGERAATSGGAWSPDSRRLAICRGATVVVSVASERAPAVDRHRGCVPAWRPDGELTFVRRGELVEASGRAIVPASAIEAAALAHPLAPELPRRRVEYEIVDVAWLEATRVAMLLRVGFVAEGRRLEPQSQVIVFEGSRVVGSGDGVGERWVRLDARNGLLAVRPGLLLDFRGRRVYPLLGVGRNGAGAVAVSPDGRWLAVGLPGRVTLLSIPALRAGRFRSVSLPFAVRDLAWR